MFKTIKDLTGQKFGRLTVLRYSHSNKNREPIWVCKCDCGTIKTVMGASLKNGTTKSCGCYSRERASEVNRTHGLRQTKTHGVWSGMIERCENSNHKDYKNYGGKGIKVCDEWRNDFYRFYLWAKSNGYKENSGLSIDRISNDKNYCPENCRFATAKQQSRNKTNNIFYDHKGKKMLIGEIAELEHTTTKKLLYRIRKKGMSLEEAIIDIKKGDIYNEHN